MPNMIMNAVSKATSFTAGVEDFWMHGQVRRVGLRVVPGFSEQGVGDPYMQGRVRQPDVRQVAVRWSAFLLLVDADVLDKSVSLT